jgi:hypothetical protein
MTLAAIDRLVHHATILEMNVESYRRRAALERKRNPGRPATHATIKERPDWTRRGNRHRTAAFAAWELSADRRSSPSLPVASLELWLPRSSHPDCRATLRVGDRHHYSVRLQSASAEVCPDRWAFLIEAMRWGVSSIAIVRGWRWQLAFEATLLSFCTASMGFRMWRGASSLPSSAWRPEHG